jgi:hypothetical protein
MGLFLEIDCKLMLKSLRFRITCFVYGPQGLGSVSLF